MLRLKIILLIFVCFISYAESKEDKLFKDLARLSKEEQGKKKKAPSRFKYLKNNFQVKTQRSVVTAGSTLESLDGTKFYQVSENTIVKTREVAPGSRYYYILPKEGEPKYVIQGEYLRHLEHILTFNEKKFKPFDRSKHKTIEFDKDELYTYFQVKAGVGSSTPSFFNDGTSLTSTNFALEAGVETFKNIPVFITLDYLTQNSGQEVQFNAFSIGVRTEYRKHFKNDSYIAAGLVAQRSLFSSAKVLGTSINHSLDSFGINISYNYKTYFLSFDLKKQNYSFDANVSFPSSNLADNNGATLFSFGIGKEFEAAI